MSFAIFHDMGNVFTDGNHMLDSLLRWHQDKEICGSQALNTPPVAGRRQPVRLQLHLTRNWNWHTLQNARGPGTV